MGRPKKVKWPVRLDVLLRLTFYKKRPEDRWIIFKAFLRKDLATRLSRYPTDQELEDEIASWKEKEFHASTWAMALIDTLRIDFLPEFHKSNREKRARAAAIQSWTKENREKRKNRKKTS
jgi:hypothetical protein